MPGNVNSWQNTTGKLLWSPSGFCFTEICWVGSRGRCVNGFSSEVEDVVGTQVGAERYPQCRITETHST